MRAHVGWFAVASSIFFAVPAFSQKGPCTEDYIRAELTKWPKTTDYYLFNPLLEKPVVGQQERNNANKSNEPLMAKRKNLKTTFKTDRVVVDPSSEMAYEYGTQLVTYDESDTGKHVETTLARLTVWRADGESCKVAAAMLQREGAR